MEEIYIMPDGTSVDISGYSEFEKTRFLLDNPKAKKSKNTAKGASTVLKKKQAPDTDSSSEKSSSGSKKKFRLPTDEDFEQYSKTQKAKPTYGATQKQSNVYEDYYSLKPQSTEQVSDTKKTEDDYKYISQLDKADEKKEILPAFSNEKNIDTKNLRLQTEDEFQKEQFKTQNPRYYHFNKLTKEKLELDNNLKRAISDGYVTEEDINKLGIYNEGEIPSKLYTQKEITEAEKKVNFFRSKLPYEVEASLDLDKIDKEFKYIEDYDEGDDFVSNMFNVQDLANIGVNDKDFNGFLLAKGYKDDIKRFKELELDKATYGNNYDSKLAWEKRKVQYLNLYLNEQIQRDLKKQKFDFIKKKSQEEGKMFDFSLADYHGFKYKPNKNLIDRVKNYGEFLKKEAPELVTAMEEVDRKNSQNYTALVQSKGNVGAGKFTLDLLENGWNGFTRTLNSFGASLYDAIIPGDFGEGLAESMRLNQEIYDFKEGENFRYVTAKGYKTTVDGVDYIYNNSNGRIYDTTNKLDVTNILTEKQKEDISNKAFKEGKRDTSFSYTGTAYQGANVIGDLVFQLALTRSFGNTLSAAGGFTEGAGILGKTKSYLKSVPIARSMSEAVIAQSTLGFTRGYEDTLKAAREAGIEDDKAKELASIASIETGVWYALTAPINPQTKATDLLFGKAKNEVLEQAINAYVNTGKKGFIETLKGFGKNFLDISGEGLAEVIQENIQQVGETYVINKDVNRVAGQQILQDSMSLQDFMDTTILSFVAGAIIPGAGVATTQVKKSTREMLGMQGVDRFNALGTLAYNKQKVSDFLSKQVIEGLYTQQQVDDLLSEIDAYSSSINRMPQDISAEAAEDILENVVTLSKLEQQKKQTDKSFHAPIEEQIDEVRSRIERRYYDDVTSKRTNAIRKAIESGKVGNIEYREFESEEDMVNTLVNDFNYNRESAEQMASNPGFILTEDNLRKQLGDDKFVPGKKVIFINNSIAADMSQFSVGKHEFLHGIIYETIKGDREAQILLGRALANEVLSMQQEIVDGTRRGVAVPTGFLRRFNQYVTKYSKLIQNQKALLASGRITEEQYNRNVDTYLGNQWEEVLTLYSDAIDNGSVVFDDDIFTKIGDMIRRVLQRLGIKDVKFNSGKDVYNFIKDYNRSIEKGTFGGSLSKLSTTKAKVNKEALRKQVGEKPRTKPQEQNNTTGKNKEFTTEAKFSLKGDRIDPEKFKSKINSYYNKDKWNSENYLDSTLYEILEDYSITIKQKAKGYGYSYLPDYSEEDMVAETQIALIPVIRNFNKEFFELREEYKEKLKSRGLKPGSKEFNDELEKQDEKGYKGKKGIVKENIDLNAYINSLLKFKMMDALKTGSVTSKQYNSDIDSEFFKESSVEGFDYEESEEILDDIDSLLDEQLEFEQEQSKLAVLLKDPVFGFTDENGNPIEIEVVPLGVNYVQDIDDPIIPANKKLKKATDPEEISRLKKQLEDLKRGLELEAKEELTSEEKEELKGIKSFKSYNLSTGGMVNTYEAFSTLDKPAKIISDEISREILRSPNIETLEYRNFKDKLSLTAQTMSRRMTFKNSADLNSFMYNNWELIYNVINNPVDPVSGESTYASKKLPPRLKQLDENGNFIKRKDINRVNFLQSFFGDEDTKNIINTYSTNPQEELKLLEDTEVNEKTGKKLWPTAYFDRRTALMELFGDVLVLQEARRLLRDEAFLESIKDRNVNLYNDLKDDIKREAVLNNMAKGKSDIVKYSLAESENAKSSIYLENLNVEDQFFVARLIDKAINNARNISKKPITFKVPDLKGMNDKVKSFFLIDKIANGYNNFEFLNDSDSKGELTQNVLNASDIKFSLASSNADYNSDLEIAMNEIISENKGIDVDKKYSPETAKNIGKNIGRYEIWMPPADDDFVGLVYRLAGGKGKLGEKQIEFFEKTLIKPYSDAMLNLMHERQQMYRDWTDLVNKKYKGITKRLRKDSGYGGYTIDQAIRVYLWNKAGYEIPGLDAKDIFNLTNVVRKDKELREFATDISYISKQPNGYIEPDHNWGFGSLISDLHGGAQKASRKKYLEHWQHNVDKIFSKDNLSKIEAVYGRQYVLALKNSLERMKSGSNRVEGGNDPFLNWLNAATGVTMFFNMRSAFLQTISMVNFINTGDNNPLKVSARMLDVNQFMKDYSTLWNSDYLKDRRSNLMSDVAEAELAQTMNDPRNKDVVDKFKAGYYFMMKQGFAPTRIADSFAIAFGGASFYRNRINTYLKQGDTQEDAEKKAMRDFYETSEASQQSADVSKISKNQASLKGRLIFAFQNTPLQYSRLITRATIDIIKGRGDFKSNIAKIVYYSTLQNLLFNFMQNALFSIMFDDEDEQNAQQINGKIRAFNGTLDTILRGSGLTGAVVSTLKNVAIKWYEIHGDPKQGGEVVVEALNISPPIGIKARKLMKAYKAAEYNADEIKYKGFSIDNTYAIEATTSLASVGFNLPVDRVYQKATNISDALMGDFDTWQRIALIFGYSRWNLGKGQKGAGLEPTGNGTLKQPGLKEPELKDKELKQ